MLSATLYHVGYVKIFSGAARRRCSAAKLRRKFKSAYFATRMGRGRGEEFLRELEALIRMSYVRSRHDVFYVSYVSARRAYSKRAAATVSSSAGTVNSRN